MGFFIAYRKVQTKLKGYIALFTVDNPNKIALYNPLTNGVNHLLFYARKKYIQYSFYEYDCKVFSLLLISFSRYFKPLITTFKRLILQSISFRLAT